MGAGYVAPRRCGGCGSIFWQHTCHSLPGWLAMTISRGNARRAQRLRTAETTSERA